MGKLAAVFDMDGLLIDTEPIWRRSMIQVFAEVGITLTEEDCMQTMGVRIGEIVDLWFQRAPWSGPSRAQVTARIYELMMAYVREVGEPMPGVRHALQLVRELGLACAIASSSSEALIRTVIERLKIEPYIDAICSADDEARGKPDPGVYLSAARRLATPPTACIAFEDSPNGVLSAKAAGMFCILVPDPHLAGDPRMNRADLRLPSLEELSAEALAGIVAQ